MSMMLSMRLRLMYLIEYFGFHGIETRRDLQKADETYYGSICRQ